MMLTVSSADRAAITSRTNAAGTRTAMEITTIRFQRPRPVPSKIASTPGRWRQVDDTEDRQVEQLPDDV